MITQQKLDAMTWWQGMHDVLAGICPEYKDPHIAVAPATVQKFAESLGWKHIEPEDGGALTTNGWQWDWWMRFDKDGKSFTASGSGFYGGFTIHETEVP